MEVEPAGGHYALMAVAVGRRTREIGIRIARCASRGRVLRTAFTRAGRQLGGGIIAGNGIILLLAWRADAVTPDLIVSSMITSIIMAAVARLRAPHRRAERCAFNRPRRCGRVDVCPGAAGYSTWRLR
jgi:hypothetical protein